MSGTELFKLFGTIGLNGVDETNGEIKELTNNAEGSSGKITDAFKKIGAAVAAYFATDKIIEFGKSCVDAAANVEAETAAFGQIMGDYALEAGNKMAAVADETGIVETRLTGYMTSLTAKFKGLGYDVSDATNLAADGLKLAADGAAFWDMSLDESVSHLNSFINGSYEGGEAIGLFANDTQMAAYAVERGLIADTKAWASLDEKTKQATRLEYAQNMYKLSGATGQAAKESDSYLNVQGNLTEAWRQFQATIGEPILNELVIPAMKKLTEILPSLSEKVKVVILWFKENWTTLKNVAAAFGVAAAAVAAYRTVMATLTIIETVTKWLNGMTLAQKLLNVAMSMNPIGVVVAAITALVAALIYLWNNCEGFRNFWKNLWASIKSIFSSVANSIKTTLNSIVNLFKNAWNTIKTTTSNVWNGIKTTITNIINGIKTTITNVFNSIKTTITNIWNSIKSFFVNIWNSIKTTVTNAVNSVKTTVTNVFNSVKTTVSNIWNGIKNAITTPIEAAKNKVKSVIDAIKGFFNFKFKWPKIPLPHFGISPSGWKIGDLLKGSIPKLGIEWYAKGAILDKPTVFGVNGSNLMAGGEAGKEAVAPIDTLQTYVKDAVRSEMGLMESYLMRLVETVDEYLPKAANKDVVLDTGVMVGAMGSNIDYTMGNINRRKERWG